MPEIHDGRAIRNGLIQREPGKQAHGSDFIQGVFHTFIAKAVPLLKAMNPDHGFQRVRRTTVASFWVMGLDNTDEPGPWHELFHFSQKAFFAGDSAFLDKLTVCETELVHGLKLKLGAMGILSHGWGVIRIFPNKCVHRNLLVAELLLNPLTLALGAVDTPQPSCMNY